MCSAEINPRVNSDAGDALTSRPADHAERNPSNCLAPQLDDAASEPDVVLTDGATIDTTTGEVRNGNGSVVAVANELLPAPSGGVAIRVFKVGSLATGDVTVTGSPAIAIVSNADIEILGHLILAQTNNQAPGAFTAASSCHGLFESGSPGGGAGFGGTGGTGGSGGLGGNPAGNQELIPLRGGCHGERDFGHPPGGGAIQIVSRTAIRLGSATAVGSIQAPGFGGLGGVDQGGSVWSTRSAAGALGVGS